MLWGLALAWPFVFSKKIADFGDFHDAFLPHMNRNDYRTNCYAVT